MEANKIIHQANGRGHAHHGWLESYHSFSFAEYYNPEKMNFGALRVLNDDVVAGGMGFGAHAHKNMEIISIPLDGDLKHQDSMGNIGIIRKGDIQVMSAGTGVTHSEYNSNIDREVKFLQIWIAPKEVNVAPRYGQASIQEMKQENGFYEIVSPRKDGSALWIHQDAWLHLGQCEAGTENTYVIKKPENGVYVFIIEGDVEIASEKLSTRDAIGVWNTECITMKILTDARVLLIDVPMDI